MKVLSGFLCFLWNCQYEILFTENSHSLLHIYIDLCQSMLMKNLESTALRSDLRKIRWAISLVIFGLLVSGVTAFPLLHELNWISSLLVNGGDLTPASYQGFTHWVLTVRQGLEVTYSAYPFIAYGTDWLAFAHIMIALYFILPWMDPARYIGVIHIGIISSIMIIPLAMICGELRGIPVFWRLIDCSFGVLCLPPLYYVVRKVRTQNLAKS